MLKIKFKTRQIAIERNSNVTLFRMVVEDNNFEYYYFNFDDDQSYELMKIALNECGLSKNQMRLVQYVNEYRLIKVPIFIVAYFMLHKTN